jgi:hypothetical protein
LTAFWSAAIHCRFLLGRAASTCRKTSRVVRYSSTKSGDKSPLFVFDGGD